MRLDNLSGKTPLVQDPSIPAGASAPVRSDRVRLRLFTVTIGLSAFLLFLTQPLYGRLILPYLGGTPAVWNTAMCFFQVVLLAGYAYAHFSLKWLGWRVQPWVHLGGMAVAVGFLPLAIPEGWTPDVGANPTLSVLLVLARGVGLPFFVLAASAPLLQRWFSLASPHHSNPYILYSASNVGSLLALVAFPLILELVLGLTQIGRLWQGLYAALAVGLMACMAILLRQGEGASQPAKAGETVAPSISHPDRWRWIGFAAVPSALLLAVTNHISTDVAAVPLLWVLPLAAYLFTFVIVFSNWWEPERGADLLTLVFAVLGVITLLDITWGLGPASHLKTLGIHLSLLFMAALLCHSRLAATKPRALHLTEFYLFMSLGGALGGMSVALIAPVIFDWVMEYPLLVAVVAVGSARLPAPFRHPAYRRFMWIVTVGITAAVVVLQTVNPAWQGGLMKALVVAVSGGLTVIVYGMVGHPRAFALALLVFGLGGRVLSGEPGVIARERSYFGAMQVHDEVRGGVQVRTFQHGTTAHGFQRLDETRRLEPTGYYHRQGPFGEVLRSVLGEREGHQRIAVVGLGTGTLGCYGQPGDTYDFYEIDPAVLRLAQNPDWFTFLRDCPPRKRYVLGDARLTLAQAANHSYDLIILDAFSSDAIPMHLMTLEALRLYQSKLKADGLIVYHISNRHADLRPVVNALAAEVNWAVFHSGKDALKEKADLVLPTVLAVVGPDKHIPAELRVSEKWRQRDQHVARLLWTDDFAGLWGVYRFQWR